jgi:hypothetical protein
MVPSESRAITETSHSAVGDAGATSTEIETQQLPPIKALPAASPSRSDGENWYVSSVVAVWSLTPGSWKRPLLPVTSSSLGSRRHSRGQQQLEAGCRHFEQHPSLGQGENPLPGKLPV